MFFATVIVWLIDLYAFIRLQDWITAVLILFAGWAVAVYSTFQVRWANRYSVSFEQKMLAVIQFYGDPVLMPLSAVAAWCSAAKDDDEEESGY